MYARIIGNNLIQLSDMPKEGYVQVIEHNIPIYDEDAERLVSMYERREQEIHHIWSVVTISEIELSDTEALKIITGDE